MSIEIPRRQRLDLNTPAELSILKAIGEVEKMRSSHWNTEAIMLLQKAKDLISDDIDSEIKAKKFISDTIDDIIDES